MNDHKLKRAERIASIIDLTKKLNVMSSEHSKDIDILVKAAFLHFVSTAAAADMTSKQASELVYEAIEDVRRGIDAMSVLQ